MFILAAWIHCFVYISGGLVARGYVHFVCIIFYFRDTYIMYISIIYIHKYICILIYIYIYI